MKKNNKTLNWNSTSVNPALKNLNFLIGEWEISGTHRFIPNPVVGKVTYSWFSGKSFLLMSTDFNQSGPPNSTAIIGSDDSAEKLSMLYFDERGVSRIYDVEFNNNVLKIQRIFTGFSQRFTGVVKDNGKTIEGIWEFCEDDINWKKDLEITYTKTK